MEKELPIDTYVKCKYLDKKSTPRWQYCYGHIDSYKYKYYDSLGTNAKPTLEVIVKITECLPHFRLRVGKCCGFPIDFVERETENNIVEIETEEI
jgi:hypothetical protein